MLVFVGVIAFGCIFIILFVCLRICNQKNGSNKLEDGNAFEMNMLERVETLKNVKLPSLTSPRVLPEQIAQAQAMETVEEL